MFNFLIKKLVDLSVILYIFYLNIIAIVRKNFFYTVKKKNYKNTYIYITCYKKHIFLAILAMLSLDSFIKGLNYILVIDGNLGIFNTWLINKLPLKINQVKGLKREDVKVLEKYYFLNQLYHYGWVGKKFFIPLLLHKNAKIILLDSDSIFLKTPFEIIRWIKRKNSGVNLYLKDYMNFTSISPVEAQYITKNPVKPIFLNTGLVCIDLSAFWKNNTLKELDNWLDGILKILESRMVRDFYRNCEFFYSLKLLEQTLYWISLSSLKMKAFNSSYRLLSVQSFTSDSVYVHFTPDSEEKKIFYKYLFLSLLKKFWETPFRKGPIESSSWYNCYPFHKFQKQYLNNSKFRQQTEKFFNKISILIYK